VLRLTRPSILPVAPWLSADRLVRRFKLARNLTGRPAAQQGMSESAAAAAAALAVVGLCCFTDSGPGPGRQMRLTWPGQAL
jgi:hypothetical protein